MSDTQIHTLTKTSWTNLSAGASNGFITNEGNKSIIYTEAATASPPALSDKGHTLQIKDYVTFELAAGQDIYGKSTSEDSDVAITTS